jgi:hypothetical protein
MLSSVDSFVNTNIFLQSGLMAMEPQTPEWLHKESLGGMEWRVIKTFSVGAGDRQFARWALGHMSCDSV